MEVGDLVVQVGAGAHIDELVAALGIGNAGTIGVPDGGVGTVFYQNENWPNGRLVIDNGGRVTRPRSTPLPGLGDRTIDVHIRKLRIGLGDEYIKTVKGVGYRFESQGA